MASPPFISAGAITNGTGGISVPWGSHQAGDDGFLIIETGGEGATLNPSGWEHVPGSPVTDIADATGSKLQVLWKRAASGAEADVSIGDSGDHQSAVIVVYRTGVASGNPWDAIATGTKNTASGSFSAPGLTTSVPDTTVVVIVGRPSDISTAQYSGWANASLGSITERVDGGTASGHGGGYGVADGPKAAAGVVDATTGSLTTSSTNTYLVLALKPPSGGSALAAAGGSTTTGTATPAIAYALAAIGVSASGGSAGPGVAVDLAAAGLVVTGGNAAPSSSGSGDLSAAGGSASGGTAEPSATVTLAAAAIIESAGLAGLSPDVLIAAAGAALSSGNTALAVTALQAAAGSAASGGNTTWAAQIAALAAGTVTTGGLANLSGGGQDFLNASGGSASGGTAGLTLTIGLQASGGSASGGAAQIQELQVALTAAGIVQSAGAGFLVVTAPLSAFGGAVSGGSAGISEGPAVVLVPSPGYIVRSPRRDFLVRA